MNSFYLLSTQDVLKKQSASLHGLLVKEAAERLRRYGPNVIETVAKLRWYHIAARQFTNVMVLILGVAFVLSLLLKENLDAIAIGAILLINAGIGFVQEFRAEKSIEALKQLAAPYALVIRDGQKIKIKASEVVPGDIVVLEEGMQIPADARLLKVAGLSTLEASLTGESQAINKIITPLKQGESLGDLRNMVFMGTVVNQGHGLAVVTATGMETEFGRIAHLVQREKDEPSPLQKHLNRVSRILALIVIVLSLILLIIGWWRMQNMFELFLLTLSLAVSAIPEGLPAIITLTLALGVQKIAKKNAIIRKLSAAETLGSTSVICTDKTGTLTENEMTVKVLYINGKTVKIKGNGYEPNEKVKRLDKEMELLVKVGALCNNATLIQKGKLWSVSGDSMEGALLTLAEKSGLPQWSLERELPRREELIFDSERKCMSTVNGNFLFTKGAPDALLELCSFIQINGKIKPLDEQKKKDLLQKVDALAKQAYRVLGFAYKTLKKGEKTQEQELVFLGLAGFIDPPREEVKEAISLCQKAHIAVVMITGDHVSTARAIARKIGLFKAGDQIVTGADLEKMGSEELRSKVEKIRIYARVSPHHKVKILNALRSKGHIVAMTGDGVNDAPALKSADIGVAMGVTGTDVAKEVSEMILMDDNFATIVASVESGRVIYRNIKKSIRFLLSANFDEILLVSAIFFLGLPLPFTPLQILWVNLLTDALPALALGTDTPEKDIMKLRPRNPKKSIFKDLLGFSLVAGLLSAAVSFIIYLRLSEGDYSIEKIRTAVFTSIVIFELLLVFSVRFSKEHFFTNFLKNRFLLFAVLVSLGLQLLAVYHPFFQTFLKTQALTLKDWGLLLTLSILAILSLEILKFYRKRSPTV